MEEYRPKTITIIDDMGDERIVEDRSGGRGKDFNKWAWMAAMYSNSKLFPVDGSIPRPTGFKSGLIKIVPAEGKRSLEQRREEKKKIKTRLGDIAIGVGSKPQTFGLFPSGSLDSITKRRSTRLDVDEGEV